ncbi:MAG: hypothetical protein QOE75_674 [Solirubrobacterales bacterium]|jgi:hypothetical protein|nr:hypothetical protein [Solirubrobacterales bacterium]
MSTRFRFAIGVLAIVVVAGAFLIWQGSRSDEGRVWPVEWKVERQLGPKRVRLSVPIEYCIRKAPRFEEPIVEYEGGRAYIELRLVPEPEREGPSGCFLNLPIAHPTITLERNLDELALFDSSTDPPQRRWPRDHPWPNE